MAKTTTIHYDPVDASPVKSFFVSMLTRDIKLEEAILDLLDNCVDGILRTRRRRGGKKPYAGFKAEVVFKKDSFMISDNCGGIPLSLHDYAFRMGRAKDRPAEKPGTVGVYGIGMKRAIFKMGRDCLIWSKNEEHEYDVHITPEWIANENEWEIPVSASRKAMQQDGTTIVIGNLYPGIADLFSEDAKAFKNELDRMVATHYAFIIDKGFEVRINSSIVKPRSTRLIFREKPRGKKAPSIQPYIFRTKTDEGVEVFLAVGFTRPIPSQEEIADEQEEKRYSSIDAGWTILCNDRAVLYCDRSELTGWGEAGIPRFHTQFIAISGIVEFKAKDPSKLPTTTTKRDIDASSRLYLQVKNKMREGMRIFTDYTNKWKGRADESKKHIEAGTPLSFEEIKTKADDLPFSTTKKSIPPGDQYKPDLPLPKSLESRKRRISFVKDIDDVKRVAEHLFKDESTDPSLVGEKCFDLILREAKK
ncbi:MAG: ATP-binding protein [Terriglobales bacterium]